MGACSQKEPALFHPGNDAGGCSQNKTNVSVSMTSAETVGEFASRPSSLLGARLPMSSKAHVDDVDYAYTEIWFYRMARKAAV